MTRAMYAFSGDPITYGHIDIIQRAAKVFDELIVGIGVHPEKNYLFSLEERTEMAQRSLVSIPNVKVVSFLGMLVDYAYEHNIPVIIRGIRNSNDVTYEKDLDETGKKQRKGIDTFLLFGKPEHANISSSMAKSIQKEQGDVTAYVPLYVKQCLEAKVSGQYVLGVTGEIGVGKSYISQKFVALGNKVPTHNIDLDYLGHDILKTCQEPLYVEVREKITALFGSEVCLPDKTINRKILGELVFNGPEKLKKLNELMQEPLMMRLKREMYGKKGLILINAALIAEADITYLCNNNVLLVTVDKLTQEARLKARNLDKQQIERRLASQYTTEFKKAKILECVKKDNHGTLWELDNSENSDPEQIKEILEKIATELKITNA